MLSRCDFIKIFLCINLTGCAINTVSADSETVCPDRKNKKVEQIYIYDGKPEDMAYLAPDDEKSNTYTVSDIYEQGRIVTIRCRYEGGFVYDVELKTKVNKCKYSENKLGNQSLICK